MKTKIVRPVLVAISEKSTIFLSDDKMSISTMPYAVESPNAVQLILISLEDEKIEVGDKIYYPNTGLVEVIEIERLISYSNYKFKTVDERCWICDLTNETKKVIATQSQLSPEYIQQFIEEYNKGEVKDIKIEWQTDWRKETILCMEGYGDNPDNFIYEPQPKLTNDYVTIVNKEVPIYTEEEVYSIMQQYLDNYVWSSGKYITPMEWFNQHKK